MRTREELIAALERAGISYEENSPTPGLYLDGQFYAYDEVPSVSEILDDMVFDFDEMAERYCGVKNDTHLFNKQSNESIHEKSS